MNLIPTPRKCPNCGGAIKRDARISNGQYSDYQLPTEYVEMFKLARDLEKAGL